MSLFTNTEVLALRAMRGDVDYQRRHVGLDKLPLLVASQDIGNYRVQLTDHPGGTGFTWNLTYAEDQYINELFNTTEFRQAMAIATDREGFYEAFFQGMGYIRNASPLPSHGFYLGEKYDTLWNYLDADQANAMLDSIGLTDKDSSGFRLRADGSGPITIEVGCVTGYFANYCGMADLLEGPVGRERRHQGRDQPHGRQSVRRPAREESEHDNAVGRPLRPSTVQRVTELCRHRACRWAVARDRW